MNFSLVIQDLLADYSFDENFQPYFTSILQGLNHKPTRLFHNYIDIIFESNDLDKMNKISDLLALIKTFPDYQKELIHLLIFRLTQNDNGQNELTSLFSKNDKAVISALDHITDSQLNKLRNNQFTRHILSVYGERKNLIDFLIDIAHSNNIQKHELMDLMLPKCVLNVSTATRLVKKINKRPIDNYGWLFIIKNFEKEPAFEILIESYFSSKNKLSEYSSDIIDIMTLYSAKTVESIEKSFTKFNNSEDEIKIIDCLEKNKVVLNYENICNQSLLNFNFEPISYFEKNSKIVLDDISLELFWKNFEISNLHISLNTKDKFDSSVLNNYLDLLNKFQDKITDKKLETITKYLANWLNDNTNTDNNTALIRVVNVFFHIFSNKIEDIDNDLLSTILKNVIKNNNLNSLNNDSSEYNSFFKLIFSAKEHKDEFFHKINKDEFFQNNKEKIPEESLKALNYYKMKHKFSDMNIENIKPQKTIKI